jgi:hypothetical protein
VAGVIAVAGLVVGLVTGLVTVLTAASGVGSTAFVTQSDGKLLLNGQVFRFSGANIFWGGLAQDGHDALSYPSPFQVDSALQTVSEMGGQVVRCQSCGISTGNPQSVEPALGTINDTALAHIDYFIARAQKYGIRLIIPLTDAYSYSLGGYQDFTNWLGLSAPGQCPSAACASSFYTSPLAISAFEFYIGALLNHVNVYTGVANIANPAIMSWELGNEMPLGLGGAAEYTRWAATISSYIKSLAPHQLVMDGARTVVPGDLLLPDVDVVSPHYYPLSTGALGYDAATAAAAGKAFVVGEYAWNESGLQSFLNVIQGTPAISGDLYWGLLPPDDNFGFVEHYDGYQLHYPGDNSDVSDSGGPPVAAPASDAPWADELRTHAYLMAGRAVPGYLVPAAPVITNVEQVASAAVGPGNLVEWRGVVGAAEYVVSRSVTGPAGPWQVVGYASVSQAQLPFRDPAGPPGPGVWYEVTAKNPARVAGPPSAPYQVSDLTLDENRADLFNSVTGLQWSQFQVPADAATVEALVYYSAEPVARIRFQLSADGRVFVGVPAADVQATQLEVPSSASWVRYIYSIDDVQSLLSGAQYVRVVRNVTATGSAKLGEIRITYPQRLSRAGGGHLGCCTSWRTSAPMRRNWRAAWASPAFTAGSSCVPWRTRSGCGCARSRSWRAVSGLACCPCCCAAAARSAPPTTCRYRTSARCCARPRCGTAGWPRCWRRPTASWRGNGSW